MITRPLSKLISTVLSERRNRRLATADRRILIVRHFFKQTHFYDLILDWVERERPELRARFDVRTLPCRSLDWSRYDLFVAWLQDPVEDWSPRTYRQACALVRECEARGIPMINRVDRLDVAAKSTASRLIGATGIRTARAAPTAELELPLIAREDRGHGGRAVRLDTRAEVEAFDWSSLRFPVAMEFIDVRSPQDGIYRKYRYLAVGDDGFPLHLHHTEDWRTRGSQSVFSAVTVAEEQAFLAAPDPNHERLQAARRALGFDFVAFDYSYTPEGELVVWEANPFPHLHYAKGRRKYRTPALEKAIAALTNLYVTRTTYGHPPS